MFNKRMVYFMAGEADKQAPEQMSGPDAAKAKMDEFMPKAEELKGGKDDKPEVKQDNTSMEEEAKQTNDNARADVMAILKEGSKQNPNQPIKGVDDWAGIMKDLRAGLGGDHFNTSKQSVDTGSDKYYFMMVKDTKSSPTERLFVKKGSDFTISDRTFLKETTDDQYKYLTGKARPKQSNA